MEAPSRIEKMVGELLGLRILVAQLLQREVERGGSGVLDQTRAAALAELEVWPVGSDTPEGAERIRHGARAMLNAFPAPTPLYPSTTG